jgi:hypothetical protein
MSHTSVRLLELLSLLQGRRDWPGNELADRLEVSGRTVRRDIERLRQLKPASTGVSFTPRGLPARDDPAAFVEQGIKRAPNRFEARVTLHVSAEEISGRVPAHFGRIEPIDAHTCEYQTSDDDLRWLAMRIAMLAATSRCTTRPSCSSTCECSPVG